MDRDIVFKVIDDEREYQDDTSSSLDRPDMKRNMTTGDILCAIEFNLDAAKKEWYRDSYPHKQTIEYLRKIAALCVKAGEDFGMPERKPWSES